MATKFVTYEQVQQYIPDTFRQKVNAAGVFEKLEHAAAIIIRDSAGIAFPASTNDTPDWVALPAGWLISHLAVPLFASVDENTLKYIADNYKRAIEILSDKSAVIAATPPADGSDSKYSAITPQGAWQ